MSRAFKISKCELLKIYCIGIRGFHAFVRLRMWPAVRTKTAQLYNPKCCGLQLCTWGLMFSFAGLGAVESSSIIVPHQTICGQGSSACTLHTYVCLYRANSVFLYFWLYICTLSIWSYTYTVYIQCVFLLINQKQTKKSASEYYDTYIYRCDTTLT